MALWRSAQPPVLGTPQSSLDSGVMTIKSSDTDRSRSGSNASQGGPGETFGDPSGMGTPLSPSSAFSVSCVGNIEHSFVDGLLLCQWDNILGPRLEHVWYVTGRPQPSTHILRGLAGQVLSGEICRDVHSNQIDFKFFDIPDKGLIMPAFVFSAQGSHDLSLQSLALVIPNSELTLYLHQADLIHSWLTRIVAKFRVICTKKDFGTSGLADLSSWLWAFMDMLSSLQEVGLPSQIELNYTVLCPAHTLELDFLRTLLASHLMTFGRSVVMGKKADRVNVIVYTLGLFCWDRERFCSRSALNGRKWPYYQDLCVQGCIKNPDGTLNLSIRDLMSSQYPTTIIDVERRDVSQSSPAAEHPRLRHESLCEEVEDLFHGREGFHNSNRHHGAFLPANQPESLVRDLIDDLHKLPAENGVRESYISHFMHSLQRRALCLIRTLEAESSPQGGRINLKRMRQDHGLQLEGDWRMVLATADKLRPGLYHHLLAERKFDNDYLPNMGDVL